jgi:hypothetical protein
MFEIPSWRACGIKLCTHNGLNIVLICLYMPCDTFSSNVNTHYEDIIHIIETKIEMSNCGGIIVCGDFNTSFARTNAQTACLTDFIVRNKLRVAWESDCADKDYTYTNLSLNHNSCIDHFVVSDNIFQVINNNNVIYDVDNVSNHNIVLLDVNISVVHLSDDSQYVNIDKKRCDWTKASNANIVSYKDELDCRLSNVNIPNDLIQCNNVTCQSENHIEYVNTLCSDIINCCMHSAFKCIPLRKYGGKVVPDWPELVKPSRDRSLFWHHIWLDCDKPTAGYVYEIMKSTRRN